jgi:hypothetical protein
VQGTIQVINVNRDWDFNLTGTNAAVAAAWPNLPAPEPLWRWKVESSWDVGAMVGTIVNDLSAIVGVVSKVIPIQLVAH